MSINPITTRARSLRLRRFICKQQQTPVRPAHTVKAGFPDPCGTETSPLPPLPQNTSSPIAHPFEPSRPSARASLADCQPVLPHLTGCPDWRNPWLAFLLYDALSYMSSPFLCCLISVRVIIRRLVRRQGILRGIIRLYGVLQSSNGAVHSP